MIKEYDDFFELVNEEKINYLIDTYRKLALDRKFISTWKNFYQKDSEIFPYLKNYIEASDTIIKKIVTCLDDFNTIQKDILDLANIEEEKDIIILIKKVRTAAQKIDKEYAEIEGEFNELERLFWEIWQIFDADDFIPFFPKAPEILISPKKGNKQTKG